MRTLSNPGRPWLRTCLLLAVALSVFGWGTAYRLSLYQRASQQNHAQQAKLATRASESDRSVARCSLHQKSQPDRSSPRPLPPVAIAYRAAPATLIELPAPRELSHLFAAALFLRPPPAL